ncbi:probable ATP-dependent RNA helicase DDX43 [Anoplophora glabripennis]|uniref:probable ATP-dependent RNA helicase DDX43 n=1 Tax=Anoplophora glabripennis TaxID=217634 RepID=UPI000873C0FA|nr:probable ATP-dependent RNA helicase DDX43 [Anoplophora glabripennis]
MCDDWDDNAPIEMPQGNYENRPICSQNFSNSNFRAARGNGRNNERNTRFQRNNRYNNSYGNGENSSNRSDGLYRNNRFKENKTSWGNSSNMTENDQTETINVPSKFIGRIIGRGGSKINELQSDSGAKIQVTKDIIGDDTVVKIFGNQDSIDKAKSLINSLTTDTTEMVRINSNPPPLQEEKKVVDWKTLLKECEEAEQAEWDKYPQIKKQFYVEHPEVTDLTEEEVQLFRQENNNIVVDRTFKKENSLPIPKPCPKFIHAFFNYPEILSEIEKVGFQTPTPIQAQAWPVLLSGEDLIGIAQTGTGKTLAFLLPALIHIDGQPGNRSERGGPAVLVMAPTRELALQIDKEVKKYYYRGITSVCVYGGGNRREQVKTVTDGVDIVIATPGRLNDLYEAGHLNVKTVTYVVLDEADRMLDMGFEPQIRKVMYAIRPTRQTVMTSATWPPGVRRLADSYMNDPIQVYVGSLDLAATHTVTQIIEMMPDDDEIKLQTLMDFVRNMSPDQKMIVFCGKKSRADEISSELVLAGIDCQSIHGNREQSDREQALIDIANGTVKILIATDVASRGLDIDDITHVLNYDFPKNIEEYVHRVGRTGRAGKLGESISYFTRNDWGQAKDLINILEEAQQEIPHELHNMAERYTVWKEKKDSSGRGTGRGRGGFGGRRW